MDDARLEELLASICFDPPAPLTDEERTAWDYFQEADLKLRQIETAKRGVRNAKQKLKNRGQASSVAFTDEERADFDARTAAVTTRLKVLRKMHDARDLENRREYEIHRTRWKFIEESQGAEDGRVSYCFSPAQLDDEMAKCLHTGGVIVEFFIDRQRLTDQERADFLAEAIQADEDHRTGR